MSEEREGPARYISSGHDVTDQAIESDDGCPECGAPIVEYPWWDDPPSQGGACIGTNYECTKCCWYDQR